MPELPEVEHLRRTLEPRLAGRTIVRTRLRRRDVLVIPGDPPGGFSRSASAVRPKRATGVHLLRGARIDRIERLGKQLAIRAADGRTLGVHLGMTGALLLGDTRSDHVHAEWTLDDSARLCFRDPRRFGGLWFFPDAAERDRTLWSRLGPDALTITAAALRRSLHGRRTPIKSALLNQSVIAGVGNIYADEALFRAAIHPLAPSDKVPTPPLSVAIRRILSAAIAHGGSSIRDYIDANGERGRSQLAHQVYGRGGLPCMRCSTTLETGIVAQRTTVWCPTCQTAERTTDRTSGRTSGQTSGQTPGRTVDQTQPRTKPRTKPSPHASGRPASRFKAALR